MCRSSFSERSLPTGAPGLSRGDVADAARPPAHADPEHTRTLNCGEICDPLRPVRLPPLEDLSLGTGKRPPTEVGARALRFRRMARQWSARPRTRTFRTKRSLPCPAMSPHCPSRWPTSLPPNSVARRSCWPNTRCPVSWPCDRSTPPASRWPAHASPDHCT